MRSRALIEFAYEIYSKKAFDSNNIPLCEDFSLSKDICLSKKGIMYKIQWGETLEFIPRHALKKITPHLSRR